jgi:hypothetical protein
MVEQVSGVSVELLPVVRPGELASSLIFFFRKPHSSLAPITNGP